MPARSHLAAVAVLASAFLGALFGVLPAAVPQAEASALTETVPVGGTTTTTSLPFGCTVVPTYDSVRCRLDGLHTELAASDAGPFISSLKARVRAVNSAVDRAEKSLGRRGGKVSKAALRKALKNLKAFAAILGSKKAQHSISAPTWAVLHAPLAGLQTDVPNLPTTAPSS